MFNRRRLLAAAAAAATAVTLPNRSADRRLIDELESRDFLYQEEIRERFPGAELRWSTENQCFWLGGRLVRCVRPSVWRGDAALHLDKRLDKAGFSAMKTRMLGRIEKMSFVRASKTSSALRPGRFDLVFYSHRDMTDALTKTVRASKTSRRVLQAWGCGYIVKDEQPVNMLGIEFSCDSSSNHDILWIEHFAKHMLFNPSWNP